MLATQTENASNCSKVDRTPFLHSDRRAAPDEPARTACASAGGMIEIVLAILAERAARVEAEAMAAT